MAQQTRLAASDIAGIAAAAGFRDTASQYDGAGHTWSVAIALAESNGDPRATRKNGGRAGTDYGLWQLNEVHGYDPHALLDDPTYNARAAWVVSKQGADFTPWRTFTSGSAARRLREAVAATTGLTHFPVTRSHRFADTWGAPRSNGRVHRGVDIFAGHGTPVVSVSDGTITRLGEAGLGGNRVWIDGRWYYAHLDSFAEGIAEGDVVTAGTVIGYVGTTGNAAGTAPHLHFGWDPAGTGGAEWANPHFHLTVLSGRPKGKPRPSTSATSEISARSSSSLSLMTTAAPAPTVPRTARHHLKLPPVLVRLAPLNLLHDFAESLTLDAPVAIPPGEAVRVALKSSKAPPDGLAGQFALFSLVPGLDVGILARHAIVADFNNGTPPVLGPGVTVDGIISNETTTHAGGLDFELVVNPFEVGNLEITTTVTIKAALSGPLGSADNLSVEMTLPTVRVRVEQVDLASLIEDLFSAVVTKANEFVVSADFAIPDVAKPALPTAATPRPDLDLPTAIGAFAGKPVRLRQFVEAAKLPSATKEVVPVDLPNAGSALRLLVIPQLRIMRPEPPPALDRMIVTAGIDILGVVAGTTVNPVEFSRARVLLAETQLPRPVLLIPASITAIYPEDEGKRSHRRLVCWDYKPLFPSPAALGDVYTELAAQLRQVMKLGAMALKPGNDAFRPLHQLEMALDIVTNADFLGTPKGEITMTPGFSNGMRETTVTTEKHLSNRPTVVVCFIDRPTRTVMGISASPGPTETAAARIVMEGPDGVPAWIVDTTDEQPFGRVRVRLGTATPEVSGAGQPFAGVIVFDLQPSATNPALGTKYDWDLNHAEYSQTIRGLFPGG